MTEPVPEFYSVPGTEAIHKAPARQGGELTFPFTPQQLLQIGAELIEQFLRRVVNALAGVFIPGLDAFTQLQNWGNDVGEFIGNIFDTIADALNDLLGAIFGGVNFLDLPTPGEFWSSAVSMFNPGTIGQNLVSGLQGALAALDDWITDIIIGIGNALDDIPIVGRDLEAAMLRLFNVRQKAVTADTRSTQIVEDVTAAWANDTPTGTPTPVFDTVVAIRESFINGYTVMTYTSNDTWTVPAGLTELWYIVIGGGGKGQNGGAEGGSGTAAGGVGGSSGGYLAQQIDPSGLTAGASVSITVGAASVTAGADGGVTTIGSVSSLKNVGSISSPFGYTPSNSCPGRGGNGGAARVNSELGSFAENGTAGESTAAATGGAAGVGGTGSGGNAGHGGNADITAATKSGGAGGGGGGGRRGTAIGQTINAGDGGNGGYPGGGSGGGGGAAHDHLGSTAVRGSSGTPGHGVAFIMYKAAS